MPVPVLLEALQPHVNDDSLILAVNDNYDSLNLLRAVLQDESFKVLTAEDGATALEMIRETKPDLIISDVVMPGIDGIELCRRLKADSTTCDIPVLLVTALRYDEADIVEGLRAGADDYLQAYAPIELLRKKVMHLIAQRKRLEVERAESDRYFRSLIENSLDVVTILNPNGTIRYESPSVERTLGYDPSELIGQSAFDFIHPDDVSRVIEMFSEGIKTEKYTGCIEFRFRHKDGSWRTLEAIGRNLLDEPRVAGVIVNSRDVTERFQMHAAVRAIDARFKLAVDSVKDCAMFMLDAAGYIASWNVGAQQISGYRAEDIIGRHLSCLYTSEDIEAGRPHDELWSAMTSGSSSYEGWRLRNDGSRFWSSIVLTALRDDQGNLEGFIKVARDMTVQREREEALRGRDELLQAILNNSPALISIKDTQGRYICVNKQFELLLNATEENIVGKTDYELFDKAAANLFRAHDQRVMKTGLPIEVEESAVLNDKNRSYISIKFPLNDSSGDVSGVCSISSDFTEHKSVVDQLRHAQKMEAIGILAGGVAHDFNNLLTAIIGYNQLLTRQLGETGPHREYLEEIEKAGKRAAALTSQLLAFGRKQILQPRVLNLNSVIEDLTRMLRRLIGEDIELVTLLEPNLGLVRADPNCIEQVIMNLAVNARDAMPEGGTLSIRTANFEQGLEAAGVEMSLPRGQYVLMSVSDTGCGMHEETLARIFDPFFTTKEPGKGTGLGLSTVYGIVTQSEGYIRVHSEPSLGSTFSIYLKHVEGIPDAVQQEPEINQTAEAGTATILVVEDDDAVRRLSRAILEMDGYTVLDAGNVADALRQVHELSGEIDLLVTDVVMPEMSGKALANSIGTMNPDLKVLFISGYADETISYHGILEPGLMFLQKPFTAGSLARKVREALRGDVNGE